MVQEKAKIIVVDDDPFVRAMLREILESGDYTIETAKNGLDALEKYSNTPDADLIISDMNMPEMDGIELIKALRDKNIDIPIIILTVNTEISVALEAIRNGANDYLLKDENIQDTILLSVEKVIEKDQLKKQNLCLLKDLEQKNMQLESSNKELVELNQQKNKFLGIAAHDLRGPLAGIIGMSELLMEPQFGELSDDHKEYLNMINNISRGMLDLLDDLLDVSVIESGKLEILLMPGNIRKLLEERIKISRFAADKKGITIHSDFSEISDTMFDEKRISQVFDNLVTNAIKFSPQNSNIYITLSHDEKMLKISVKDEGPGISEEDRSRLFGEFQRLSARPTAGETSTGLGLAIAKKIIESHNGILEVHSEPDEGAEFVFQLSVISEQLSDYPYNDT